MRGNITKRGRNSYRLKIEAGYDATGKRRVHVETIRGTKKDAQIALAKLVSAAHSGTMMTPTKTTVETYLRQWLDSTTELTPKTLERYRQLAELQIIPHLGRIGIQQLRPGDVQTWHGTLLKAGGKGQKPLAARTVGHAHRVLHRALELALKGEIIARNVAHAIDPPRVRATEIKALSAADMALVLERLQGHRLYPLIALALGTGGRRGEMLALAWANVDLDAGSIKIERSLEETKEGLRFKSPKTSNGRRTISISPTVIAALQAHRKEQAEQRLALGMGKPDLVFTRPDGAPIKPDDLSRDWVRTVKALKLPRVMFHALRHSHASALIASRLDLLTISRRLGHESPTITLKHYGHLVEATDDEAAKAIEKAMTGRKA